MMYKWGHPIVTLPSDGGNYTSLSPNGVNSANHVENALKLNGSISKDVAGTPTLSGRDLYRMRNDVSAERALCSVSATSRGMIYLLERQCMPYAVAVYGCRTMAQCWVARRTGVIKPALPAGGASALR
eukprot:6188240-Pleurochrysis_carterae.AAC.1